MEKKGAVTLILERFVFSENIKQLNMFCHLRLLLPTISLSWVTERFLVLGPFLEGRREIWPKSSLVSLKTLIKNLGNLENTSRQLLSTSPLLSFVIFPVLTFIPPSLFVCVHLHFHSHRPTRLPQGLKINLTVLKIINLVEAEGLPVTCTVAHFLTPYFYSTPPPWLWVTGSHLRIYLAFFSF